MSDITKDVIEDIRTGKRELNISENLLLKDFFDKIENNFKVDSEITCIKASNTMMTVCKDNNGQMNKYGNKEIVDIFSQEFISLSFSIGNSPKTIRVYVREYSKTPYMTVEDREY
ncbi:hypothetical protein LPJ57_004641 [Coemansia sp. RSA 486]|nr:hypothetical protein LPJ57_004641 [Coemansia sp. RSA 486]KAJ2236585.1 hypothetical protein IWW45_001674 [Coemansia sp. RSA 485]KAJ2595608.1 hypothetical protein GGF39_003761 [Coemansia sp. RSA 1721]KAJ2634697.1 hypothetical protein GGF40_004043 [Coemansia sp. RSA 1286]